MLRQTPLNAVHRAAGAKMVDFGGWEMPVSYGSQIEEHHAVRSDAGMFDVSHMLAVDLGGGPLHVQGQRSSAARTDQGGVRRGLISQKAMALTQACDH